MPLSLRTRPYTTLVPITAGEDPMGVLTWTLGGPDAAQFSIVGATGVVSLAGEDFENPQDADRNNTYLFTVIATDADGNFAESDTTTITITDDDEEIANFTVAALADATIVENTPHTTLAPITDGDDPIGVLTWTLGGPDAAQFSIDSDTGVVSLAGEDFENPQDADRNNTYLFTVIATDADGNFAESDATTITITDDDTEIANFTVAALADATIVENTPHTTLAPITDGDAPIGVLTWTLGGLDAAQFSIDSDTGVVSLAGEDFEDPQDADRNNAYLFTVTATDADGNDAESATTTITITDDDTETATFTVMALADATIVENTPHTTLAPTTAGEDPMGVLTWTLGGPDAAQFSIVGATGVVSLAGEDFEDPQDADRNNTYLFTVTATDADGNEAESATTTITITDDDTEIATFTVMALADATIVENTPHTTLAPTTAGEDPMGVLTWTLGGPDAAQFSIVGATGVVSLAGEDFEDPQDADRNNAYLFTVTATDADGNDAESATTTITITDDDTETATFTVMALADATIVENTPHTTLAPTTAGEDPMGVLTWTLGGPDAAQFSIVGATGVVSLAGEDFEDPQDADRNNTYLFTVTRHGCRRQRCRECYHHHHHHR